MNRLQFLVNVATPIVFVIVGVLANRLGRKDGDNTPLVNYFAAGTTVLMMSLATIFGDVHINSSGSVDGHFGWMLLFLLLIFISIDIDRYSSWERDCNGYPTNRKNLFKGVLLPNFVGILAFIIYRFAA